MAKGEETSEFLYRDGLRRKSARSTAYLPGIFSFVLFLFVAIVLLIFFFRLLRLAVPLRILWKCIKMSHKFKNL